jgi:argininosuccinate lyase
MSHSLWGGRFEAGMEASVLAYTSSLSIDARLAVADLKGCLAHVRMLGQSKILNVEDTQAILQGLEGLLQEVQSGRLKLDSGAEDIHSEIERWLKDRIGAVAGKMHTARSRNDQVATATRLYLREEIDAISQELKRLQNLIMALAEKNTETLLPGLTHTQHAQPVSLAHHLLASFWMFERDRSRLKEIRSRVNQLPLGSAALAGTRFPIQRDLVAKELGFEGLCENSMDAVSDRDFAVEFLNAGSLILLHLSRLAEELVLWSAPEFGFVELADSVTTGSSIMPQKKNPDVAELIRGRVGRLTGAWVGLTTTLKALPLAYNRDLQEDKFHLFQGLDCVKTSLPMMTMMLESARFFPEKMSHALKGDFSNATDLADDLAAKGLPFREAHEIVGKTVRWCLENRRTLESLSLAELKQFSPLFTDSTLALLPHDAVMKARTSSGGAAPSAVRQQLALARKTLA